MVNERASGPAGRSRVRTLGHPGIRPVTAATVAVPPFREFMPVPACAAGLARRFIGDAHQAEGVGGVAGPIVRGAEADPARAILLLMVPTQGFAAPGRALL